MEKVVGNGGKHPGFSMINCPMCEIDRQSKEKVFVNLLKEKNQFYAVEYAGFWNIQKQPGYESPESGTNILDAEQVGEGEAEYFANLIVKLLNNHYGTDD